MTIVDELHYKYKYKYINKDWTTNIRVSVSPYSIVGTHDISLFHFNEIATIASFMLTIHSLSFTTILMLKVVKWRMLLNLNYKKYIYEYINFNSCFYYMFHLASIQSRDAQCKPTSESLFFQGEEERGRKGDVTLSPSAPSVSAQQSLAIPPSGLRS